MSEAELELKLITPVNSRSSTIICTNENSSTISDTTITTTNNKNSQPPAYTLSSRSFTTRSRRRLSDMRFQSNVRPVLTPLGQRLITLSERKLYSLEPPIGGRDEANLLKGILIQESVRNAWRQVEQGHQVQVNDWQSNNAMGLDVIGEEEEEEEEEEAAQEERSERWFEELVQSFGDDEMLDEQEHEWAESEVGSAVDEDDFEYYEEFEHYTLPSPPSSPTQLPSSPPSTLSTLASPPTSYSSLGMSLDTNVTVDVVEVSQEVLSVMEVSSGPIWRDSVPSTPLLSASRSPTSSPITSFSLVDDDIEIDHLAMPEPYRHRDVGQGEVINIVKSDHRPSTPILSASCSPSLSVLPKDDELDCDDLTLPPALHRCSSTSSILCDCEDFDSDDDCDTPPLECEDLDNSIGSLLSLHLDDEQVINHSDEVHYFGLKGQGQGVGLGLDIGLGIDVVHLS